MVPTSTAPSLRLLLVGDLILDEPDPGFYLEPSTPVLRSADVVVGHVEVPHSLRGSVQSSDVPAHPAEPDHLAALRDSGFHVATLAGNHMSDAGPEALVDTVQELRRLGIATAGAGANLQEARRPAVVEAAGLRVGVLSYNCVGPREGWARPSKAGCAHVNVLTHYELDYASPGGPPTIYTFATPESLDEMRADVSALRESVDTVVVALHKGVGHLPAVVAMYEPQVARAAIDAGADIVVGHHAHILRGIEFHRGKPIFHGLGNFVTVTRALSTTNEDTPEQAAWAKRRQELFGFVPDPDMPAYAFHPESRNTIIADCLIGADGSVNSGLIPCWIDDDARPTPLGRVAGGPVVEYVRRIGERAGLAADLEWDGDRVRASPPADG